MNTPIIDADKTRISLPIPMIVTVLIGLAGIGGSFVAKASSWNEEQKDQDRVQDLRIQRLEDRYDHIAKSLDEIKVELKEQRRGR